MQRKLLAFALCGLLWGNCYADDEFYEEPIGKLRLGLPGAEAAKAIFCPVHKGREEFWGADGAWHQEWRFPACGVLLGMVSEQKGGAKTLESVTLTPPSQLRTQKGIHIGSSEQEVAQAYRAQWNKGDSIPGEHFVAGSLYGGLVFSFQAGKVVKIFLGASAE